MTKFKALVDDTHELPTLLAMQEQIHLRIAQVETVRLGAYMVDGWLPNPPGLVCQVCGSETMGKLYSHRGVERMRCMDPLCGQMWEVQVS